MKKKYQSPKTEEISMNCESLLSSSLLNTEKVTISENDYDEESGCWE